MGDPQRRARTARRGASPPHSRAIPVRLSYVGVCGSDLPKLLRPATFALPDPGDPATRSSASTSTATRLPLIRWFRAETAPVAESGTPTYVRRPAANRLGPAG